MMVIEINLRMMITVTGRGWWVVGGGYYELGDADTDG